MLCSISIEGGALASWLVRSSPDRVVRVRALAGDIVLCSWARHLTLTVPLSTQVYKMGTYADLTFFLTLLSIHAMFCYLHRGP